MFRRKLFDAEGGSGVGLHGAAARDVAGEGRGGEEESSDDEVGDGVEGFYAEEKSGQVAGEPEGADGSEERAGESGTQALANGHAKNIGASGAECDAETDFGRAARDGVGEYAVNAGCGEEKGQHAEDGQENGIEALRSDGTVHDLIERAHVGNGEIGIEFADERANGGNEGQRIVARVNDELAGQGVCSVGKIDGERRIFGEAALATIPHNTHNFGGAAALALPEKHLLSDGILVLENLFGETITEYYPTRIGRHVFGDPDGLIVFIEKSAANEGKPDRCEIPRRNDAPSGPRGLRRRLRRVDAHAGIAAFDGALIDGAGCQNLRVRLEALEEAIEKLFADAFFPIRPRHADGKHEAILGVKATVYSHELFEAADEETGTDKQKKRQRHFTSDQNVAKPALPAASGLAITIAKSGSNAGSRRLKRGGEAGQNASHQGDENREGKHPGIEPGVSKPRYAANFEILDDTDAEVGDEQSYRRGEAVQQKRLHHHEANQACAASAESGAHGDFAHARGSTSEEKIGNIQTSDEKKKRDSTEENPEGAARGITGNPRTRRREEKADALVLFGEGLRERGCDLSEIGLRGFLGDAGFEAADDLKFPTATVGVRAIAKWRVKLIVDPGLAGRKNADDDVGFVVEAKSFAQNVWIAAKARLPEFVAKYHNRISKSATVIVVGKIAAENRGDTERAEEAGADFASDDLLSRAKAR